jgi:hypothetical protein
LVCHAAADLTPRVWAELYHDHGLIRLVNHQHDCPTQTAQEPPP